MEAKDSNTEVRILEAARKVFHQKGLGGARMAEIATEAGINKAMLHYYFRSKEKLFEKVFQEAFTQLLSAIMEILASDLSFDEKLNKVAGFYVETLEKNPQLPVFVLSAIQQDADGFVRKFISGNPHRPPQVLGGLMQQIKQEAEQGNIRPIDPRHLVVNLIAMSIFPFMMRPVLKEFFNMSEEDFSGFVRQRKQAIPDFIRAALRPE